MGLCIGVSHAFNPFGGDDQPYALSNGSFSTSQSTPIASSAELAFVIVETSGSVAGGTLTLRDGTTDKLSVSIGTSAGSQIIDLSATPVLFKSSINLSASVVDGGINYTVIYKNVSY
jgi:hypothetical protein